MGSDLRSSGHISGHVATDCPIRWRCLVGQAVGSSPLREARAGRLTQTARCVSQGTRAGPAPQPGRPNPHIVCRMFVPSVLRCHKTGGSRQWIADDRRRSQLLVQARSGPHEFAAFYRHFERPVLGFFVNATGRSDLAADLTAETFARALEAVAAFDPARGRADQWLFGIARTCSPRAIAAGGSKRPLGRAWACRS